MPDVGYVWLDRGLDEGWEYADEGKVWDSPRWGGKSPEEYLYPDIPVEDFNKPQEHLVASRPIHLAGYLK